MGRAASMRPSGVRRSEEVVEEEEEEPEEACVAARAPRRISPPTVAATEALGGGVTSSADASATLSLSPSASLSERQSPSSGDLRASGGVSAGKVEASPFREKSLKQTPGRTRPARPRRCFAAALDAQVSCRRDTPFSGSCAISLTLPVSMTTVTSSIVTEVSATLVETTTLRPPGGGRENARACASGDRPPWRGRTSSCPTPLPAAAVAMAWRTL